MVKHFVAFLFCSLLCTFSQEEVLINFSEYPVNTYISNQYEDHGITFIGDNPFITTDGANPTSPVLSGTPRFEGAVGGSFTSPVSYFEVDAGYFNELYSTRLITYDYSGNVISQQSNSQYAIQKFIFTQDDNVESVKSWIFNIFANEPAGYAIDNVKFTRTASRIVFRDGYLLSEPVFWGIGPRGLAFGVIPGGFDHVAFYYAPGETIYESHPGYDAGTYRNTDGTELVGITNIIGVQGQFTLNTFKHNSMTSISNTDEYAEIGISQELAEDIQTCIIQKLGSGYQDFLEDDFFERLLPRYQKGLEDDLFTCVGLIEWAAECAGVNNGQGFIPDEFESQEITIFPGFFGLTEVKTIEIFSLTPQLLYNFLKNQARLPSRGMFFFVDPVLITVIDPLGRIIGGPNGTNEIPDAMYTGDADIEQIFIPNPISGVWKVIIVAEDEDVGIIGTVTFVGDGLYITPQAFGVPGQDIIQNYGDTFLVVAENDTVARGDVNGDGILDQDDIDLLSNLPTQFVNDVNDPRDVNQDGIIDSQDVSDLEMIIVGIAEFTNDPTMSPVTFTPTNQPTMAPQVTTTDESETEEPTTSSQDDEDEGNEGKGKGRGRGEDEDEDGEGKGKGRRNSGSHN